MLDHLVHFSARPTMALFIYEVTVSLKNKEDLDSNYEEQGIAFTRDQFKTCFLFLFLCFYLDL